MKKRVTFRSIEDFEKYCKNGNLIFYHNGLRIGYDLLISFENFYRLDGVTKKELEDWLIMNEKHFVVEESRHFYWPNDNMFSGDNSIKNVLGYVLKWRG